MKIEIRSAKPQDASLLAWVVQTALDMEEPVSMDLMAVCADTDTLYSWQNARIVSVDGVDAGCLISYPGEHYMTWRNDTWRRGWPQTDEKVLENVAVETFPGEYYLDSMALKPAFRGLGLGKQLMLDGMAIARKKGCSSITLIVDVDKPHLQSYYAELGFEVCGSINFFGHQYNRMKALVNV